MTRGVMDRYYTLLMLLILLSILESLWLMSKYMIFSLVSRIPEVASVRIHLFSPSYLAYYLDTTTSRYFDLWES